MERAGGAGEAEADARVLDRAVRVVELRAHRSDALLEEVPDHRPEPARADHVEIVVAEADELRLAAAAARLHTQEKLNGRGG